MRRTFVLHTPLDPDDLKIVDFTGKESLSTVSEFDLKCVSGSPDIEATDLLGKDMTLEIVNQEGNSRFLNGIVTRFAYIGPDGSANDRYTYHVQLHSWLWLADHHADPRIYQEMDVKTIIEKALKVFGMPVEFKTNDSYPEKLYTVCLHETTLNFIKRQAEEVGMYFYTRHEMGKHTIVFADGAHPTLPDYEEIPFLTPNKKVLEPEEHVLDMQFQHEVKTGRFVTDSYNFQTPTAKLQQSNILRKEHDFDSIEFYEWSGTFDESAAGDKLAAVRREQLQLNHQIIRATSNVRGIAPGYVFTLTDHPRADANQDYLIIEAVYRFHENADTSRAGGQGTSWDISFTVRPSSERYYAPKVTQKPKIVGPQTAVVAGPPGEEIWCDKYGRIKATFPWDRRAKKNHEDSCWIRIDSSWAGSNFGFVHIPRVGQEIIIEYFDGDPDRPIVISRVYNQNQMPPWDLPANATQSGMLSRSTKHGQYGNANALRFEDKKGAEQVWLQAERNMDTIVEANDTQTVGANRVISVGGAHSEVIKKDTAITVTEGNHSTTIAKGCHTTTVSEGDQSNVVSAGSQTVTVKGDITVSSESGSYKLTSPTKITLEVGGSSIVIEPSHITLTSAKIDLNP